jgi:hypothetical protein
MKNKEAIRILNSLQKLEGYKNESGTLVPFQFSAGTMYAIAKNVRKLQDVDQILKETHQKLLRSFLAAEETSIPEGDPRIAPFIEKITELYESESDYVPFKINLSALNLDLNYRIPQTDLVSLLPIIDEDSPFNSGSGPDGVPKSS